MGEPLRLLIADTAPDRARIVTDVVRSCAAWADAHARIALSYDEALEAFAVQPLDVAIVDTALGAGDGLRLLREIRRRGIHTPVLVCTSGEADVAAEALAAGAADAVSRAGLTADALHRAIRYALALHAESRHRRQADDRVRAVEAQLRQAHRTDVVGRLVGGVAHDFNNMLTAILGYCHLMREQLPDDDPLRQDLQEVQSAGERAASLTRQLLAFSPRQAQPPQVVDINAVVAPLEKLLRRLIREDVELATTLAPDLHQVTVDPASVEQILVNLAVNASDAMPAGGRMTIQTANVDLGQAGAMAGAPVAPGPYVMLAVGDTGPGTDVSEGARASEAASRGLAAVEAMVKQSSGHLGVDRQPGRGSVVRVYLPVSGSAPAPQPERRDVDVASRGETVLLVEDEDAVRALAHEVLRRRGYVVLDARDGVDALSVAERHPDVIQLLVTDMVMPRLGGRELAERIATTRPAMRVLFMSGYLDRAAELNARAAFLPKPFTPDALARKVRSVLDGGGAG